MPRLISRHLRTLLGATIAIAIAATLQAATPSAAQAATITPSVKPVMGGLLDRQREPTAGFRGTVDGYVVDLPWSDLQIAADGPITSDNVIDQAIANAKVNGLKLKLRVTAGIDAPEWAKRLDGPPVLVVDDYGNSGTTGRFWTPRFGRAYNQLQTKLAARYDNAPELLLTQITRCTTFYAEPFLRQGRSPESVQALLDAGYTATLDEQCHRDQIDAHKVWVRTRTALSFNPYQRISSDGRVTNESAFAEQMMDYLRSQLGVRAMLENHSIRSLDQGPLYDRLYTAIRSRHGAIGYQTAAPDRIGDLDATLAWAVNQGASLVELPVSYRTTASPTSMLAYNRDLNATAAALSR